MKLLVILVTAFTLFACTGQSQYEDELAQKGQWEYLGLKDGESGRIVRNQSELELLNSLSEADIEKYMLGYQKGIEDYCLPYNTYKHGKNGQQYTGQCLNTANERLAVEGWEVGYKEYVAGQDLLWLNSE
ncbi:DUF2799 domain-containing protein [Photobacterium sanctipauli]|uniref:DUF2799 domain-containing protein n=1 Tax=Photobacterium sanctipauli TaxID=1342794 RepID=A0A2T3NP44_9GAMM|nr:DUF2799 domain-containing protein [Photobacterium sanctipauli]PSW18018.1 DUF2799 domain-containing protein [Photobacterium sanctipauli]